MRRSISSISVGQRIDFHAQAGRGFVDQVDGLVRQEAVGDIALRKHSRGHDGGVLDAHAVVDFIALLQAAQNRDRVLDGGLADRHGLEAALEGRVLFDVFAVFVERSCADGTQLAASQRGLQHVRGVHRAFGGAGADEGVQLVDEQNDLPFGFGDFLQHGLQPVLEFAAIFRARHQGGQIQRDDPLGLQNLGHVAGHNSPRQPFDDGGLADAGLADEHGIVFRAARENLHHAANLLVAADHRIELPAAGKLGEVARVLLDRAIGRFGILRGDAMAAANRCHGLQDGVVARAALRQQLAGGIAIPGGDGQQDMFG